MLSNGIKKAIAAAPSTEEGLLEKNNAEQSTSKSLVTADQQDKNPGLKPQVMIWK